MFWTHPSPNLPIKTRTKNANIKGVIGAGNVLSSLVNKTCYCHCLLIEIHFDEITGKVIMSGPSSVVKERATKIFRCTWEVRILCYLLAPCTNWASLCTTSPCVHLYLTSHVFNLLTFICEWPNFIPYRTEQWEEIRGDIEWMANEVSFPKHEFGSFGDYYQEFWKCE